MNNAIYRSVGFECVPRELVAKAASLVWPYVQSRAELTSVNAGIQAYVAPVDPLCRRSGREPDPQSGCLDRGFEMHLGVNGFDF